MQPGPRSAGPQVGGRGLGLDVRSLSLTKQKLGLQVVVVAAFGLIAWLTWISQAQFCEILVSVITVANAVSFIGLGRNAQLVSFRLGAVQYSSFADRTPFLLLYYDNCFNAKQHHGPCSAHLCIDLYQAERVERGQFCQRIVVPKALFTVDFAVLHSRRCHPCIERLEHATSKDRRQAVGTLRQFRQGNCCMTTCTYLPFSTHIFD